jgi:cell pole-organizing protein PopZ
MEEILASIRRIIESNEPGAGKAISQSLPPLYAVSGEGAGDETHLTVDDALTTTEFGGAQPPASPDPRFVAANSPGTSAEAELPQRSMSLADVAARVRAASERNSLNMGATREAVLPRELPPSMAARLAETRSLTETRRVPEVYSAQAHPVPSAALERQSVPAATIERQPLAAPVFERESLLAVAPLAAPAPQEVTATAAPHAPMEREVAAPANAAAASIAAPVVVDGQVAVESVSFKTIEVPASEPAPDVDVLVRTATDAPLAVPVISTGEDRFMPTVKDDVSPALLSEATGAQVARSFEELAAAVDGSQRRSLDEIAQDLLRPMLQEWLDDNLPTLVERLVREEIERVARGPRR